jgi:hypothetical protein
MTHDELVNMLTDHFLKAFKETGPLDLSHPALKQKPEEKVIHDVANEMYRRGNDIEAEKLLDIFHGFNQTVDPELPIH